MSCLFAIVGLLIAAPLLAGEARHALVIGCDYEGTDFSLPSPVKEAGRVAATLRDTRIGFKVTLLSNPSRKEMLNAIKRLGEELKSGGVGLFYFSGHGAQHEGNNYLIPSGAELNFREDLTTETVSAESVVTTMETARNRVNLLFLDACRNNPLPSSRTKGFTKGLTTMSAANGMLIGFAAARGTVARDSGEGSLYTNALLSHLLTPGISVTDMLTRVNAEVRETSSGKQIPFMEVGLSDLFVFVPGDAPVRVTPDPSPRRDPAAEATKEKPFINSVGIEFVPVPGTGVLFARKETTRGQWRRFVQETNHRQPGGIFVRKVTADGDSLTWETDPEASWERPGFNQNDEHPVVGVSWEDARAFCAWLSRKEGRDYRLPRDTEWSRAVGSTKYPWGDDWPPRGAGNYSDSSDMKTLPGDGWPQVPGDDGYARTAPVGSYEANRLGLHDLGGNVLEWCEDEYRASLNDEEVLNAFPVLRKEKSSDGTAFRVLRGGAWKDASPLRLRSSCRSYDDPRRRDDNDGFRCVLSVGTLR